MTNNKKRKHPQPTKYQVNQKIKESQSAFKTETEG
jgi:hypothetical protein